MSDAIIYLDPDSKLNLQNQIRQKLVGGVLNGAFPPGIRLPSSRKLADQLEVARNTVVLAYQQLVAEGYLVSRQRSGIFVNQEILDSRVGHSDDSSPERVVENAVWRRRIKGPPVAIRSSNDPPNWRQYPFPFIDGKFESSLFPLAEWREANRLALSVADGAVPGSISGEKG
jgi:GntR family transcriptional regulator/MocR family aminotransferase